MGRGPCWRVGAVVAATVAFFALATAPASSTTTKTKVVDVYPFTSTGSLKAGLKLAGSVKGTCWTGSIAVASSDAYRCISKSVIYDPCFTAGTKPVTQLACMSAPWSEVTLFDLTSPIPRSAMHPAGRPRVWADQLGNGLRCIADTGTGNVVDKVVLNYYCTPGKGWASIPDEKLQPWTVKYASSDKAKTLQLEQVTTAWY